MQKKTDIIVVGGGAAGMMAAITAARAGSTVMILEHNPELGKKILATGNGRCNFTNSKQGIEYYHSTTPGFVASALGQFSAEDSISFFQDLGVMAVERMDGYWYPRTMQALTLREALLNSLRKWNVFVCQDIGIRSIKKDRGCFLLDTKSGVFRSKALILATGGKADPKSGSDGSGYLYAQQLGHTLIEPTPALVPLLSDAEWLKDVKGVRQDSRISLYIGGHLAASDQGEVQFTDYGISGIPTFQLSSQGVRAWNQGLAVEVSIDFVPNYDGEDLFCWMYTQTKNGCHTSLFSLLQGMVNQKIANVLCQRLPFNKRDFKDLSKKQLEQLLEEAVLILKDTRITITGSKNFHQAQVTAGGISTAEVDAVSMESLFVNGLYFAGEVLDVDGLCGGYNLQWAWSSGYAAGNSAVNYVNKEQI